MAISVKAKTQRSNETQYCDPILTDQSILHQPNPSFEKIANQFIKNLENDFSELNEALNGLKEG